MVDCVVDLLDEEDRCGVWQTGDQVGMVSQTHPHIHFTLAYVYCLLFGIK